VITEYNTDGNQYIPDPFGRIHKETKSFDGKRFTVGYDYDVMGRMTKVTYPTGQAVEYQYNSLGQLLKVPGYVDETPVYDNGGLLKSLKAANGITAGYDYDQNGRLVGLSYSNQASNLKSYTLKYDETNNIIKKNNDNFQYDLLNQMLYANLKGNFEIDQEEEKQKIGKTRSDFKGQKTFEFELSQMDIIELDYAAGSIGVDLLAPVKVTKIELQPNSPIHRVTKSTSIRLYISQDNITYTRLKDWKMATQAKGKLEIVLDTPVTARFIKVKSMFDERDSQLNPVNAAQFMNVLQDLVHVYYLMNMRQEEYSYDKIGNRKTETVTQRYPVSRIYTYYPNSSRLKSNGKWNFNYDASNNLIQKETITGEKITWKYEYDLFNRLVKVKKNDNVVTEYMYDEAGLRIKKQATNGTTYYIFDTGDNVLFEQEGKEYTRYVYVNGRHFARIDGNLDTGESKKYFIHTDHLGSTVAVTDETGKKVWDTEYCPFGKTAAVEGELKKAAKFTGKDFDEDVNLWYYGARWYDQEVGRFISEDPKMGTADSPMSYNPYLYCLNRPLIMVDPDGRSPVWILEILLEWALGNAFIDPAASPGQFAKEAGANLVAAGSGQLVRGKGIIRSITRGAIQGATYSGLNQLAVNGSVDWRNFFRDMGVGAGLGFLTGSIEKSFYEVTRAVAAAKKATTEEVLTILATKVDVQVEGRGPVSGTYRHSLFKKEVEAVFGDNPLIKTETTYLAGQEVKYGTKGGVRIDVIEYNPDGSIKAVYDLKTGGAKLTEERISEIRKALRISDEVPVTEIKPAPAPTSTATSAAAN